MANEQQWNKDQQDMPQEREHKNAGNFKNDPERAARVGRKGGKASRGKRSSY